MACKVYVKKAVKLGENKYDYLAFLKESNNALLIEELSTSTNTINHNKDIASKILNSIYKYSSKTFGIFIPKLKALYRSNAIISKNIFYAKLEKEKGSKLTKQEFTNSAIAYSAIVSQMDSTIDIINNGIIAPQFYSDGAVTLKGDSPRFINEHRIPLTGLYKTIGKKIADSLGLVLGNDTAHGTSKLSYVSLGRDAVKNIQKAGLIELSTETADLPSNIIQANGERSDGIYAQRYINIIHLADDEVKEFKQERDSQNHQEYSNNLISYLKAIELISAPPTFKSPKTTPSVAKNATNVSDTQLDIITKYNNMPMKLNVDSDIIKAGEDYQKYFDTQIDKDPSTLLDPLSYMFANKIGVVKKILSQQDIEIINNSRNKTKEDSIAERSLKGKNIEIRNAFNNLIQLTMSYKDQTLYIEKELYITDRFATTTSMLSTDANKYLRHILSPLEIPEITKQDILEYKLWLNDEHGVSVNILKGIDPIPEKTAEMGGVQKKVIDMIAYVLSNPEGTKDQIPPMLPSVDANASGVIISMLQNYSEDTVIYDVPMKEILDNFISRDKALTDPKYSSVYKFIEVGAFHKDKELEESIKFLYTIPKNKENNTTYKSILFAPDVKQALKTTILAMLYGSTPSNAVKKSIKEYIVRVLSDSILNKTNKQETLLELNSYWKLNIPVEQLTESAIIKAINIKIDTQDFPLLSLAKEIKTEFINKITENTSDVATSVLSVLKDFDSVGFANKIPSIETPFDKVNLSSEETPVYRSLAKVTSQHTSLNSNTNAEEFGLQELTRILNSPSLTILQTHMIDASTLISTLENLQEEYTTKKREFIITVHDSLASYTDNTDISKNYTNNLLLNSYAYSISEELINGISRTADSIEQRYEALNKDKLDSNPVIKIAVKQSVEQLRALVEKHKENNNKNNIKRKAYISSLKNKDRSGIIGVSTYDRNKFFKQLGEDIEVVPEKDEEITELLNQAILSEENEISVFSKQKAEDDRLKEVVRSGKYNVIDIETTSEEPSSTFIRQIAYTTPKGDTKTFNIQFPEEEYKKMTKGFYSFITGKESNNIFSLVNEKEIEEIKAVIDKDNAGDKVYNIFEAMTEINKDIGNNSIIAHNGKAFDFAVLKRFGLDEKIETIDSKSSAQLLGQEENSNKWNLQVTAERLGIEVDTSKTHQADYDVKLLDNVIKSLIGQTPVIIEDTANESPKEPQVSIVNSIKNHLQTVKEEGSIRQDVIDLVSTFISSKKRKTIKSDIDEETTSSYFDVLSNTITIGSKDNNTIKSSELIQVVAHEIIHSQTEYFIRNLETTSSKDAEYKYLKQVYDKYHQVVDNSEDLDSNSFSEFIANIATDTDYATKVIIAVTERPVDENTTKNFVQRIWKFVKNIGKTNLTPQEKSSAEYKLLNTVNTFVARGKNFNKTLSSSQVKKLAKSKSIKRLGYSLGHLNNPHKETLNDIRTSLGLTYLDRTAGIAPDGIIRAFNTANSYTNSFVSYLYDSNIPISKSILSEGHSYVKDTFPIYEKTIDYLSGVFASSEAVKSTVDLFLKLENGTKNDSIFEAIKTAFNNDIKDTTAFTNINSKKINNLLAKSFKEEELNDVNLFLSSVPLDVLVLNRLIKPILDGDTSLSALSSNLKASLNTPKGIDLNILVNSAVEYKTNRVIANKSLDPKDIYEFFEQDGVKPIFDQIVAIETLMKVNTELGIDGISIIKKINSSPKLEVLLTTMLSGTKELQSAINNTTENKVTFGEMYRIPSDKEVFLVTTKELEALEVESSSSPFTVITEPTNNRLGVVSKDRLQTRVNGVGINTVTTDATSFIRNKNAVREDDNFVNIGNNLVRVELTREEIQKIGLESNIGYNLAHSHAKAQQTTVASKITDIVQDHLSEFVDSRQDILDKVLSKVKDNEHPVVVRFPKSVIRNLPSEFKDQYVLSKTIGNINNFNQTPVYIRKDYNYKLGGYNHKFINLLSQNKHTAKIVKFWQQFVLLDKLGDVILNIPKLMSDFTVSIGFASANGASVAQMLSYGKSAIDNIGVLSKDRTTMANLVFKDTVNPTEENKGLISQLQKNIEENPLYPLWQTGQFQGVSSELNSDHPETIQDLNKNIKEVIDLLTKNKDGESLNLFGRVIKDFRDYPHGNIENGIKALSRLIKTDTNLFKSSLKKLSSKMKTTRNKKDVTEYIAELTASPASGIVSVMSGFTMYSDLVARYIVYKSSKDKGVKEVEAVKIAKDTFIDYDQNLPQYLDVLNVFGLANYVKWKAGVTRPLYNLVKNNPITTAFSLMIADVFGSEFLHEGHPLYDIIMGKNPISTTDIGIETFLPTNLI